MTALAEVYAGDRLFVRSEELVKRPADEFQREQVRNAAMREDLDLEFHWEAIPRRGRRHKVNYSGAALSLEMDRMADSRELTLMLTMMQRCSSLEAGPSWQMFSSLGQKPSGLFSHELVVGVRSSSCSIARRPAPWEG